MTATEVTGIANRTGFTNLVLVRHITANYGISANRALHLVLQHNKEIS